MFKNIEFQYKTMFFQVFAGCVRERNKGIKNTWNMRAKSIPESINIRCENGARKRDAKMMENGANMDPQSY